MSYQSPDGTFERVLKSVLEDYTLNGDEAQMINYAAAKPAGWVFHESKVAEETGWKPHKVRMAFRGLRKRGYFVVYQERVKGRIISSVTKLDRAKVIYYPSSEPGGGNPSAGSDLQEQGITAGQHQEAEKPPGGNPPPYRELTSSDDSAFSDDSTPPQENTAYAGSADAARDVFDEQMADDLSAELAAQGIEERTISYMVANGCNRKTIVNTINKQRRGTP